MNTDHCSYNSAYIILYFIMPHVYEHYIIMVLYSYIHVCEYHTFIKEVNWINPSMILLLINSSMILLLINSNYFLLSV